MRKKYLTKEEFVETMVEMYRLQFGNPIDLLSLVENYLIMLGYE